VGSAASAQAASDAQDESRWRAALDPYSRPDVRRSLICLATSVVPYFALLVVMYLLLPVSYALVLLVAIPASGFLVRIFIVFHDCGHGSFWPTRRGNTWIGRLAGLIVYSPFHAWTHEHAQHHAGSGDLDRRGMGDVDTWTVAEYESKSWLPRLGYRLFRNPLVMFALGPLWSLALEPRFIPIRARPRMRNSRLLTNLALIGIVVPIVLLIGWRDYLLIQVPVVLLGGGAGVWLFYVQHIFEDAYWEHTEQWSYVEAALAGSSYLKLPKVLQFFSGNIGLHHIHHLLARIPNYNLQRAHEENAFLHRAPTISFWQGMGAVRLKLYDEDSGRMVTWGQLRALRAARRLGGEPVVGSASAS
jgi:omega-6 fatty acid desaturase (delta-12 desaturase)